MWSSFSAQQFEAATEEAAARACARVLLDATTDRGAAEDLLAERVDAAASRVIVAAALLASALLALALWYVRRVLADLRRDVADLRRDVQSLQQLHVWEVDAAVQLAEATERKAMDIASGMDRLRSAQVKVAAAVALIGEALPDS